ncbi:LOW QUALITY PROTEIN: hypothetical protein YC2023_066576 [Brassica napus]
MRTVAAGKKAHPLITATSQSSRPVQHWSPDLKLISSTLIPPMTYVMKLQGDQQVLSGARNR